ncbi:hypothetical protein BDZ45DRAFT_781575 [Acephala macrosclerotiorum]|nr:hypothetical protein BDZ45DRAFT_781575 [Acephala macrosclerotiorum]
MAKVVKALRKHGGAEDEYRAVSLGVEAFGRLIEDVESLEANKLNSNHISAIIEYSSCAKAALEKFLKKISNYKASLGEGAQVSTLADWIRRDKMAWALFKHKRIEEMRDAVWRAEAGINTRLLLIVNDTAKCLDLITKGAKNSLNQMAVAHHEDTTKFEDIYLSTILGVVGFHDDVLRDFKQNI